MNKCVDAYEIRISGGGYALLLEHDNFVVFQIFHVHLLQHMLLFWAQAPDMGEYLCVQKVFFAVIRIVGGFECIMMQAMILNPVVYWSLYVDGEIRARCNAANRDWEMRKLCVENRANMFTFEESGPHICGTNANGAHTPSIRCQRSLVAPHMRRVAKFVPASATRTKLQAFILVWSILQVLLNFDVAQPHALNVLSTSVDRLTSSVRIANVFCHDGFASLNVELFFVGNIAATVVATQTTRTTRTTQRVNIERPSFRTRYAAM